MFGLQKMPVPWEHGGGVDQEVGEAGRKTGLEVSVWRLSLHRQLAQSEV